MEKIEDFETFYHTYESFIRKVQFRIVGERLLDDSVQESFIKLWKYKSSFKNQSSIKTWIYKISVNVAIDLLKKNKKSVDSQRTDEPSVNITDNFLGEEIEKILKEMPIEYRLACIAVIFEEMSIEETAHALEVPEGTIKSRVSRGREILKNELVKKGYYYE